MHVAYIEDVFKTFPFIEKMAPVRKPTSTSEYFHRFIVIRNVHHFAFSTQRIFLTDRLNRVRLAE